MSLLGSVLTSVGGAIVGNVFSKGYDYVKGLLPAGAQSFLGDVGDFLGVSSKDVSQMTAAEAKAYLERRQAKQDSLSRDMPKPTMMSVGSTMAAGTYQGAGPGAQMLPLGSTDRVSRAIQDQRVAEKLMRMSGGNVPTPNLRIGQTISLSSATPPRTRLTKKFSK